MTAPERLELETWKVNRRPCPLPDAPPAIPPLAAAIVGDAA